jgi:hypothetical protein
MPDVRRSGGVPDAFMISVIMVDMRGELLIPTTCTLCKLGVLSVSDQVEVRFKH